MTQKTSKNRKLVNISLQNKSQLDAGYGLICFI